MGDICTRSEEIHDQLEESLDALSSNSDYSDTGNYLADSNCIKSDEHNTDGSLLVVSSNSEKSNAGN